MAESTLNIELLLIMMTARVLNQPDKVIKSSVKAHARRSHIAASDQKGPLSTLNSQPFRVQLSHHLLHKLLLTLSLPTPTPAKIDLFSIFT